jgi:hypothetical protein
MVNTFEVTCITRNEQAHPQEQITHIGGINLRGRGWRLTRAEAIDGITSGRWSFYVSVRSGERVNLVVGVNQRGAKYLKTELDNGDPTTLLALPQCAAN